MRRNERTFQHRSAAFFEKQLTLVSRTDSFYYSNPFLLNRDSSKGGGILAGIENSIEIKRPIGKVFDFG
jgi:hypothetical protein